MKLPGAWRKNVGVSLPSSPPQLPKWPFLLADAAFLAAAGFIAAQAERPLGAPAALAIAGCVAGAAAALFIPFLVEYSRRQDEALDERQRSLEALAQTVSNAAEQIGIAASGLHEIAELAQKNLKHAEHLPQRLQERVAELEASFSSARDDDREELERELSVLRGSESERLESTAEKIARAATDWAKAEAAAVRHVAAAKSLLAEIDQRLAAVAAPPIVALPPVVPPAPRAESNSRSGHSEPVAMPAPAQTPVPLPVQTPAVASTPAPVSESAAISIDASASPPAAVVPSAVARIADAPSDLPSPVAVRPPPIAAAEIPVAQVPAPAPAPIADQAPVVAAASKDAPVAANPLPEDFPAIEPAPVPASKKRSPRKPVAAPIDDTPLLDSAEFAQESPEESAPASSVSADGATRLLVTAYIGIGNRLFIRGDGPGLNWDKGVPLQFVSIGKWRWETPEATAPISFKLLKNDRDECKSPADSPLEPGRQQELTATF